jgi:hypothetical protein
MSPEIAELTVQVDLGRTPLQGALTDGRGLVHPFTGWLQLITAIEAAVGEARGTAERD